MYCADVAIVSPCVHAQSGPWSILANVCEDVASESMCTVRTLASVCEDVASEPMCTVRTLECIAESICTMYM